MSPATLVFDLDGTLSDNFDGIANCILHALAQMQCPPVERAALAQYVGPPLRHTFAALMKDAGSEEIERAVQCYRERYTLLGWRENSVYAGIPDALVALTARGHRLLVCTSKPQVFAERIVAHFELDRHFARVYGSDLAGAFDDKTKLLAHLVEHERIDPAACAMIGDRAQDMQAAQRNDIAAIGALWGYGTRRELEEAGAQRLIERPADLLRAWA